MLKKYMRVVTCCLLVCSLFAINAVASDSHVHRPPLPLPPFDSSNHPHSTTYYCSQCGEEVSAFNVYILCPECNSGLSTAQETATDTFLFTYFDGDAGMGVPIFAAVPCYLTYTNTNKHYSMVADEYCPNFFIFSSVARATAEPEVFHPDMYCIPPTGVEYYNNSNLCYTEKLTFGSDGMSSSWQGSTLAMGLLEMPSHTVTQAGFGMSGSFNSYSLSVETQF